VRSVLIVDDEVGTRESLKLILKRDYDVLLAKDAEEAFLQIKEQTPDVILLDIILPDQDGLRVLEKIKKNDSDSIIIMITATKTVKTAVEAMKLGAFDYITKPFDVDELRLIVSRALSTQALQKRSSTFERGRQESRFWRPDREEQGHERNLRPGPTGADSGRPSSSWAKWYGKSWSPGPFLSQYRKSAFRYD
jgi:DNA-binding NtrC family response regulator